MGGPPVFCLITMVGMNVPEHRGVTQLALAAPGDPRDDRDEVRRQPDCGVVNYGHLEISRSTFFDFWGSKIDFWE